MDNLLLDEMIEKQIKDCPLNKLLSKSDMKRIIKYIDKSIFNENECCIWKGYITNNKSKYINFYFKGKKIALHRLLYLNFKGKLYDNTYLTFTCPNKGNCCNINHCIIKKTNKPKYNDKSNNNIVYFD